MYLNIIKIKIFINIILITNYNIIIFIIFNHIYNFIYIIL